MKKPSQISPQQAKDLELQITHLKATKKSLEKHLDDQRKQIDSDNKEYRLIAIEAVNEEIADSKEELKSIQDAIKLAKSEQDKLKSSSEKELSVLREQVTQLEDKKAVLEITNETLTRQNRDLESQETVLNISISTLTDDKSKLVGEISEAENQVNDLKDDKETLETNIATLIEENNTAEATFTKNKENWNKEISLLELRYHDLAQKILDEQGAQEEVSSNLADWQTKLEGQDQNLRIREEKLNQQRKVMTRNSNLLNL